MLKASKRFYLSCAVFALTAFPVGNASAQNNVDFEVSAGKVIPSEDFAVRVSVLGAAIEQYDLPCPVTLEIRIDEASYQPFGPLNDPQTGNVNINKPARHFTLRETFGPGTEVALTGISWKPIAANIHRRRTTQEPTPYVHVLRDGDPVPDIRGYRNQSDAAQFVRNYIDPDTNTMLLHENQVIYLFELGTDNLGSSAADFQDFVVLATLGESPEALDRAELMDAMYD